MAVLTRLAMELMRSASRTELLELQPTGIISAILLGCVISLTAHRALHRHNRPVRLRLLGHCTTSFSDSYRATGRCRSCYLENVPRQVYVAAAQGTTVTTR